MELGIVGIVAAIISFIGGWFIHSMAGKNKVSLATERAEALVKDAEKEARNLKKEKLLEVKDEWLKKKQEFDNEMNNRRQKNQNLEKKLENREDNIEKKLDLVNQNDRNNKQVETQLLKRQEIINNRLEEVEKLKADQNVRLEKTAGLTTDEAKKMLMENVIDKAKSDAMQYVTEVKNNAKAEAKKEAQKNCLFKQSKEQQLITP